MFSQSLLAHSQALTSKTHAANLLTVSGASGTDTLLGTSAEDIQINLSQH